MAKTKFILLALITQNNYEIDGDSLDNLKFQKEYIEK